MLFWYNLALLENTDGLFCMGFDGNSMKCGGNHYTWGAAADSAYEYMLKQWVLSNGQDEVRVLGLGAMELGRGAQIGGLDSGTYVGSCLCRYPRGKGRDLLLTCVLPLHPLVRSVLTTTSRLPAACAST